jgi:hypothetical protein
VVDQIGVKLDQEEDSVQRGFRHLARQEERQDSFKSQTLDGGFTVIHQRLNEKRHDDRLRGVVVNHLGHES